MKMNSFIAGICLFFSSLFSCQQKGDFKSVSVEDFSTLIADPEMQREHPKGETFPVVGAEELQVLAETYAP